MTPPPVTACLRPSVDSASPVTRQHAAGQDPQHAQSKDKAPPDRGADPGVDRGAGDRSAGGRADLTCSSPKRNRQGSAHKAMRHSVDSSTQVPAAGRLSVSLSELPAPSTTSAGCASALPIRTRGLLPGACSRTTAPCGVFLCLLLAKQSTARGRRQINSRGPSRRSARPHWLPPTSHPCCPWHWPGQLQLLSSAQSVRTILKNS